MSARPPSLERVLEPREREIGDDRERARGERARPDLRRVIGRDPVEDERAESAGVDVGADGGDADDGDGRDPQPGHDDRQSERQLDADEHLPRAHAHPLRRFDDVGGNVADSGRHVARHDHQRERDHGDDDVGPAEADQRNQQREKRERRYRVERAGDRQRGGKDARTARRPDTEGERDRGGNRERGQRDHHVLVECDPDQIPVAREPAHGANSRPRTRPSSRSMSGPSGRSWSSAGTSPRTRRYTVRAPAPSASGASPRKSTAWAAIRYSIATRYCARSTISASFSTTPSVIGAWSSICSDTGRKSSDPGFARRRMSL